MGGRARLVVVPRPVSNPPNPWLGSQVEFLGEPPPAELVVYAEDARSIVSANESEDVPFRWSVNPYRGCYHACAYCYARTTHQYLGWGAGTDFDRRIVVKTNAAELLRKHFDKPSWKGDPITFSGVTDCYQPLEASYELTRRCLEVALAYRNPVNVITKGALVRRDVDLLAELARVTRVEVFMSVPFADDRMAALIEPTASAPSARLEALRILADAGVPTGVAVAPVIPGLNDSELPEVLERAAAAGARRAFTNCLRLSGEVRDVFLERVREALPLRAEKILSAVRDVRGGRLNESRIGRRMEGAGPRWDAVAAVFAAHCRRLGLVPSQDEITGPPTFRRPSGQRGLFDDLTAP